VKTARDCCWRLIKALEDCAERGETMPAAWVLAERLEVAVASIHRALNRLISAGLVECLAKGGGTRSGSYRLNSGAVLHGAPSRRPRGTVSGAADRSCTSGGRVLRQAQDEGRGEQQAVRTCLRCHDTFLSAHKGNRICDACKSHSDFGPGGEAYGVALSR
jgi:hypothetical protein